MALLAAQELEQLLAGLEGVGVRHQIVGAEGPHGVGDRREVVDRAVPVRVVQSEGRHAHFKPRPDGDGIPQERVQPVGLDLRPLRRQQGRSEGGILHERAIVAAVGLDLVARDAVAAPHEVAPVDDGVHARRALHLGLFRLDFPLEAQHRCGQQTRLRLGEAEVGHTQFLERLQDAPAIVDAGVEQLLVDPVPLGVGHLFRVDEGEIELRKELAALLRELRPDRLHALEPGDLVATVAAVPPDGPAAEVELAFIGAHLGDGRPRLLVGHDGPHVAQQDLVHFGRFIRRVRLDPVRAGQPHEIGRHVGHFEVVQPQVGHVRLRAVVARIPDPVEQPHVAGLVADGLQGLSERAARPRLFAALGTGHVAAQAAYRLEDALAVLGVAAARESDDRLVLLRVREQVRDHRVDLDLVAHRVFGAAGVRVVPDFRHPGAGLDGARVAEPAGHPFFVELRADLRQVRAGFPQALEPDRLVAGVAPRPFVHAVGQVQVVGLGDEHLSPVALGARSLGHPARQHGIVPEMRLLPVVLLFPFRHLLARRRAVGGVDERDRLPHPFVANRAPGRLQGVRRRAADVGVEVGVGAERLRVVFEAGPVDGQMAGLATVHLRHADEVHVVHDVRGDRLAHRQGRRHEVEQRRVQQVVVDQVGGRVGRDLPQPLRLPGQAVQLVGDRVDLRVELGDARADAVAFRRQPLDLQPLFDPALVEGGDLVLALDLHFCRRGRLPAAVVVGVRFVAAHLEIVPVHVVDGLREVEVLGGDEQLPVHVGQLVFQLGDLDGVGRKLILGGGAPGLELRDLGLVDVPLGLRQIRARHLALEAAEPPLVVLPLPVVVVPDHPHRGEEHEEARRGEDHVQEIDVVGVSDCPFVCHGARCGLWVVDTAPAGKRRRRLRSVAKPRQMLKKNSGIATTYFRLNNHRVSIFTGSDSIDRNRSTVT